MANRFRRMPAAPEVDILNAEIRRNQRLVPSWNSKHGRVIPNSGDHTRSGA